MSTGGARDAIEANAQLLQYSAVDTHMLPAGLLPTAGAGDAFDATLAGAWALSREPGAVATGLARLQATSRRRVAAEGYCDVTSYRPHSACGSENSGAFHLLDGQGQTACFDLCMRCERCRFISYSVMAYDCSWFHSCDVAALKNDVKGFHTIEVGEQVVRRTKA